MNAMNGVGSEDMDISCATTASTTGVWSSLCEAQGSQSWTVFRPSSPQVPEWPLLCYLGQHEVVSGAGILIIGLLSLCIR